MKLCINCQHHRASHPLSPVQNTCTRKPPTISPVTGEKRYDLLICDQERSSHVDFYNKICGPSAKFYKGNDEK